MDPYECDDSNLRPGQCAVEGFGVDEDGADFIQDDKAQQVCEGVDWARGAVEVGVAQEGAELTSAVLVIIVSHMAHQG